MIFLPPAQLIGGMVRISPRATDDSSRAGREALSTTLIESLSSRVSRVVVDATGLKGNYDIDLQWAPDDVGLDNARGPSIFTALQEQLGLRLKSSRAPVEVLVIDRVERPSDN